MSHPIDVPEFNWQASPDVWYLAHPVAADDQFTYAQNMAHCLHMLKLCWEEGFRCVAPWYELCLIFDETNMANRIAGLEADCKIVTALGRIILTGHKVSRGMQTELTALSSVEGYKVIDVTGFDDVEARETLRWYKNRL